MLDYISEELETDDMLDALIQQSIDNRTQQDRVLPEMTQEEALRIIREIAQKDGALDG